MSAYYPIFIPIIIDPNKPISELEMWITGFFILLLIGIIIFLHLKEY